MPWLKIVRDKREISIEVFVSRPRVIYFVTVGEIEKYLETLLRIELVDFLT
jgi:hypothetical protein